MTQQAFSQFTGISSSVLSGIFTGRTKPTIKQVEAIRKKIPTISLAWLLFGEGSMYVSETQSVNGNAQDALSPTPQGGNEEYKDSKAKKVELDMTGKGNIVAGQKKLDTSKRKITEIRVFYDDNTYEAFVPKPT